MDTLNVYRDMAMLAARAGTQLRKWSELQRLAKLALSKLTKRESDEGLVEAAKQLAEFAAGKGKSPYGAEDEPEEARKARFEAGLEKNRKKKFKAEEDRLDHLIGLARVYGYYPGAVALYDEKKGLPGLFDNASFLGSALARAGRAEEAWKAIRTKLPSWWPVEETQVAPVILVTDDAIEALMTRERCEEVLRTPRGPEA